MTISKTINRRIRTIMSTSCIIMLILSSGYVIMKPASAYAENTNVSNDATSEWISYDYTNKTYNTNLTVIQNNVNAYINEDPLKTYEEGSLNYGTKSVSNDESTDVTKQNINYDFSDYYQINPNIEPDSKGIVYIDVINGENISKCTGSLIARNMVLTSASCVTKPDDSSKLSDRIMLYPGREAGTSPYGYYRASVVYMPQAWRINGAGNSRNNIALIQLQSDVDGKYPTDYGALTYGYGWWDYNFTGVMTSMISYPSVKDSQVKTTDVMFRSSGVFRIYPDAYTDANKDANNNVINEDSNKNVNMFYNFAHNLSSSNPGSDGAGFKWQYNNHAYIIGVNTEQRIRKDDNNTDIHYAYNIGTRFTQKSYSWVHEILKENK